MSSETASDGSLMNFLGGAVVVDEDILSILCYIMRCNVI